MMYVYHCKLRNPDKIRHPASRHQHVPSAITLAESLTEAAERFTAVYIEQGLEPYDVGIWMGAPDVVYGTEDGYAIC